ncbi:hypothetical protein SALBM135S_02554 [Streptomyces alboniger]
MQRNIRKVFSGVGVKPNRRFRNAPVKSAAP